MHGFEVSPWPCTVCSAQTLAGYPCSNGFLVLMRPCEEIACIQQRSTAQLRSLWRLRMGVGVVSVASPTSAAALLCPPPSMPHSPLFAPGQGRACLQGCVEASLGSSERPLMILCSEYIRVARASMNLAPCNWCMNVAAQIGYHKMPRHTFGARQCWQLDSRCSSSGC